MLKKFILSPSKKIYERKSIRLNMIIDYKDFKVIMDENTGNWLALENEGANIYEKYINEQEILDSEINAFIQEIKGHLSTLNKCNENKKGLSILLTNQCNFECLHCFYDSSIENPTMLKFNDKYTHFIAEYIKEGLD